MSQMRWNFIYRIRRFLRWLWEHEGSPGFRARGLAIGVFCGCFPLFGLQTLLGVVLARIFRGNYVLAATGTWISNPITYAPLYWFNYKVGILFLGDSEVFKGFDTFTLSEFLRNGWSVVSRLFVGSFLVGLISSCIFGLLIYLTLFSLERLKNLNKQ